MGTINQGSVGRCQTTKLITLSSGTEGSLIRRIPVTQSARTGVSRLHVVRQRTQLAAQAQRVPAIEPFRHHAVLDPIQAHARY